MYLMYVGPISGKDILCTCCIRCSCSVVEQREHYITVITCITPNTHGCIVGVYYILLHRVYFVKVDLYKCWSRLSPFTASL